MSCTLVNFYLHRNWIWALKQAQISAPDHIYNTWYLLNLNFSNFSRFHKERHKAYFSSSIFCMFLYTIRSGILCLFQCNKLFPDPGRTDGAVSLFVQCHKRYIMHVRGIVITCDVPIQSERVNTILAEILWSRGSYRPTSTITKPKFLLWSQGTPCQRRKLNFAVQVTGHTVRRIEWNGTVLEATALFNAASSYWEIEPHVT